MKKKSFRILSLIMAFVMVIGSFGSFSQTVQAAEKEYEIYPIPHTMAYQDGSFTISDDVNVVLESGIDKATQDRLTEVAAAAGVTTYTVSNAVVEGKTNILVGINGSEESVDSYFWEKFVVTDGLFDKLDSYVLTSMDGVITVLGKDADAAFYGLTSLYHIATQLEEKSIRNFIMEDYADVASRGFIEGYYGNPWSVEDRCNLMEWGGYYKLNSYFYAPKDDPKHNSNWRALYTEEEIETKIKPLAEAGNASKCRFVFALHPYMHNAISYSSEAAYQADLKVMQDKFAQVIEAGVRQIAILADDAGNVGSANYIKTLQDMTEWVKEMQKTYPDLKLTIPFCTQEYMSNGQSYYANFPENIQIVMTGGRVWGEVSNNFTTTFTNNVGRGPYMWINWPCTDNSKQHLIMGGYTTFLHAGVDPSKIQGIVLNPMQQSEPSKVAIFGNACYSWNIWESNDEADQCWNDSFKHVDHKSAEETAASNALRELSKHMINQNMDDRVTALQESVDLSPALTEAKNILNANGTLSDEQITNLIAEFTKLQEAAVTYRNEASDTNIRDQIVYWLNCWDDTTEAAIAYLNAIKAIQDGESNAVVWDYYSAGQTAFENSKTYGFHYVDHTEYAEVGVQHIVPFIKAMETNLSVKVATIVDPSKIVATYITNRNDTPTGDIKNVTDGSTGTEVVYKSPSNIAEGTYVGILYSKPITIKNVTFNMGALSNANDRFATAKIQYTEDGTNWVDLNDEIYTTADITVEDLDIKAMGIRLVNNAYVDNKWLGVREITVNAGVVADTDETATYTGTVAAEGIASRSGAISNVTDGDITTEAMFAKDPYENPDRDTCPEGSTVTLTFNEAKEINRFYMYQGNSQPGDIIGGSTRTAVLEYQNESDEWVELGDIAYEVEQTLEFNPVTAKAVRVRLTASAPIWWRLGEIYAAYDAGAAVEAGKENVLTNAAVDVSSVYTDTMTSLNPAEGVTLKKDEYVGIVLPRIKDLSEVKVEVSNSDGLFLEASKNMVDWEMIVDGEELPDARYIRLYNNSDSAVTFDIITFEVHSNEVSGPYLYDSDMGYDSAYGYEDCRDNGQAFDGNISTETIFADFPRAGQYIIYDLGSTRPITNVKLYSPDSKTNYIRDAKIYISENLTSWVEIAEIGDGIENTSDASVTCINSDAGYKSSSTYPNNVYVEGALEIPVDARYLKIEMTAQNMNRFVAFNEIVINNGEYVSTANDPTFEATVIEAQGFEPQNMIDGDLTTAYKPGSNAAGSIVYTLSENLDVKKMNIVQKGTASDAKVSVLVKENGEKVWAEVGTLSKSLNEISLPLWDQIFAVKFEWEANKIPTISEIVMLCGEEYASSARGTLVDYMEGLNVKEADYTTASYAAFAAKYAAAEAALEDNNSTEAALANELKELQAAVAGLVKRGNIALVEAELTAIAALKEADYTAATWAALKAEVVKAEAVVAKGAAATEAEVAATVEALQQAKAALVSNASVGKADLAKYIADNDLNNLDTSVYMSAGAKAFSDALAAANALLEENATAAQYTKALKDLQDARAALVLKATQTEVDALKTLIDSYKEESYTASSWAVFAVTADKVKADADKEQTSEAIVAMTAELNNAAKALVLRGNAGTLETLLGVAEKYDADKYTEESFAGILAVIAKIEKALENPAELLQAEVDALDKEFWAADKALVQVSGGSGDSGNSGNTGSSGSTSQPQPSTPASPTTGDTANILAYAAVAMIALAGVYFFRRKRA